LKNKSIFYIKSVKKFSSFNFLFRNRKKGWIGSDVCHSIILNPNKVLYLFGDTLIGKTKNNTRLPGFQMINNSIGILNIENGKTLDLKFHWKGKKHIISFFEKPKDLVGDFIWPTNGIIINKKLYIFCMAVNNSPDFSINIVGTIVIKINNYFDEPEAWVCKYWDFEFEKGIVHSALYHKDDWLYLFGAKKNVFDNSMILGRMRVDQIARESTAKHIKYYSGDNNWDFDLNNAIPMFSPGNSESNIYYHKDLKIYFTTTYVPKSNKIYLLYSKHLYGPWSKPKSIYTIPEHNKNFKVVSYAVRIQTWLSDVRDSLIISYATNEWNGMDNLLSKEGYNIYRPYFIEVKI